MDFDTSIYDNDSAKTLLSFDTAFIKTASSSSTTILYYELHKNLCSEKILSKLDEFQATCLKLMYYEPQDTKKPIVNILNFENTKNELRIYFEYFPFETLREKLDKSKFDEETALNTIHSLIPALKILQVLGISHGGIFPGNILFDKRDGRILLGPPFLSPINRSIFFEKELISYDSPAVVIQSSPQFKDNIWSLGILLQEMIYGFGAEMTLHGIKLPQYKKSISKETFSFMKNCLEPQAAKRPGLAALKRSPAFGHLISSESNKNFRVKEDGLPNCELVRRSFGINSEENSNFFLKKILYFALKFLMRYL